MAAKQTSEQARRERVTKDDRRDAAYLTERKRIQTENAEKTARLRGLRLQKEAAERVIAEQAAAELAANPPPPKASKSRKKIAPPAV